jgi:hypothetical protein
MVDLRRQTTQLVVQKHMVVLGPQIAVERARKVTGLAVSDSGEVKVAADPELVLRSLFSYYLQLSPYVARQLATQVSAALPGVTFPG